MQKASSERAKINPKNVYRLQGLTCTNCSAQFERNVKELENVQDAQVNFGASKLTVVGDVTVPELEKAGAFDGIKVYPEKQKAVAEKESFWKKRSTVRTSISLLLLIIGILSAQQYGEHSTIPTLLYALSVVVGGCGLFFKGFKNLLWLRFDMNTLMTVAIIGASVIGRWQEGAIVVFLFALSEALERYSMDKARQSIRLLMEIAPNEATIKRGNQEMIVAVDEIRIGDIMLIKPGQKIAMDGVVKNGNSTVNQATITGESLPVPKTVDDEVFAGTLNEEGFLEVKVTKDVENTAIAKIIHLVEEAQSERAPSQAFVEKFAKFYTPIIMLIAFGTVVIPPLFFNGGWGKWVYEGLAILVVGCPCALIISTPVAIVTAIGNSARNGVLIKGGVHLEETGALKVIAFDKTGTITMGIPEVTDFVNLSNRESKELLAISAGIEKWSQHPLASAIIRKADSEAIDLSQWEATKFSSITGKGASGTVGEIAYYIGNPRLFEELLQSGIPDTVSEQITMLQQQGKSVMLLGTQTEVLALVAVADQVRSNSADVINKLHRLGIVKTVMLTGDNRAAAEAIGRQTGITDVQAELLPQDKLQAIKQLQNAHGKVAMIGDGVNDAPALAAATVGIAMGGAGTATALETADVALMADDLSKLPYTIKLSRKTLQIIKQNVTFSLAIKVVALLLVIPGWLTLWIAIFADMGATLIVTLNALRLLKLRQ